MHADLTGDDEEHGQGGGNHAPVEEHVAVDGLPVHNGLEGEGDPQRGALARHAAHRQHHQHEGQLVGDHGHHFPAQAHPGEGGAGGGSAHDHGHTHHGEQVEDDHQVRGGGVHGVGEHGDEQGHGDQGGKAQHRRGQEQSTAGVAGDDGLLAAALEKIIPGLEQGRAHPVLHPGHQLAVQARQQHSHYHTEQEAGEYQHMEDRPEKICHVRYPLYRKMTHSTRATAMAAAPYRV